MFPCRTPFHRIPPALLFLSFATGCGSDASLGSAKSYELEGDEPGECSDSADNDVDGLFDCDDPDCAGAPECQSEALEVPSVPGVAISPSEPTSTDALSCTVTTPSADPQGDPVTYTFTWRRDGVDTAAATETLSERETTRGETWSCVVTPQAGDRVGEAGEASVVIANAPPVLPSIHIEPEAPVEGVDDLVCISTETTDPDGDIVHATVGWQVNGLDAPAGTTAVIPGDTMPADRTTADEVWTCILTIDDENGGADSTSADTAILPCDADGDGYDTLVCGGGDCDDTDSAVSPAATEICDNGVDDNCDGDSNGCSLSGELTTSDATAFYTGEQFGDYAGYESAGGRDLDGDGYEDSVTGAYAHDAGYGIAWVLHGPVRGHGSLATAAARIKGDSTVYFMGHSVLLSHDLTGDGNPDVVVGASATRNGTRGEGSAYVFAGPITGDHGPSSAAVTILGDVADGRVGWSLTEVPDVDGVGTQGLAVGAYGWAGSGTERRVVHLRGAHVGHPLPSRCPGRLDWRG